MATVIDAFITTLGLDGTLFRRGMQDADRSRRSFDDNSRRGDQERETRERQLADARRRRQAQQDAGVKNSVDGYRKIRNELLGLAAIFTAGVGIKDFITNTINSAANLGYLSANLKTSTQELTAWQRASERAGGSSDGIIAQLKESQDTLAQLATGMGPNEGLQNFFRWGGNSDDLKDGNTYLLARSRIIHDMFAVDPAKAALIAKSMGISEDQFNFLKQGPAAVMDLVRAQEKNSAVTQADAAAALELKNKMLDLRDSLQATATRIILQLAPTIEALFARLEKGADWVQEHKEDIKQWVDTSIVAIGEFITMADKFATAVGGWQNVLIGLASLPVLSGLGAIATAIGAIATAGLAIPALVAAIAALAAYGGYKGAEFLFGPAKDEKGDELRKKNAAILAGGKGDAKPKTKDELRVEAEHQKANVVTGEAARQKNADVMPGEIKPQPPAPRTDAFPKLPTRDEMRVEAARQKATIGPTKGPARVPDQSKEIIDKLKAMGWTSEQAAGITASFTQESTLDPNIKNSKSGAYGIGQWLGSRVDDFKKFAGRDLVGSTLDQQLAFFNYEVTQGKEKRAGNLLKGATTAEDASRIHSQAYERPGKDEANNERRARLATQLAATDRMENAAKVGSIPSGAAASTPNVTHVAGSTNTTTVSIDKIEVQTQATDAIGIASALRPAVEKYAFANQANSGMR